MYRRMKMLLGGLILSTGLLVATPVSYATETQVNGEEDIELAYLNIGALSVTLNISNGKAVCCTKVHKQKGSTINVSMYLQKYTDGSWRKVKGWTGSSSATNYELRKSYDIQKGKYRVLSTIKIGSESDTKTSKSVTN